jgi:hypothetical protein
MYVGQFGRALRVGTGSGTGSGTGGGPRAPRYGRRPAPFATLAVGALAAFLALAGCSSSTATPSNSSVPIASPLLTAVAATSPATTAPSPTTVDGDDESDASSVTGASFFPGSTGLPFAPGVPSSTADRLPGEPDPTLTPGSLNPAVTQATISSTICVSGWTATIRPPSSYTTGLKIKQMADYGYTDRSTAAYEEDHLISLELGGAPTDPRNLWPEPYTASLADGRSTGAHVKDGYETTLKKAVCAGTVSLATAQSEIGDHWVHAYYGVSFASGTAASLTPAASNPGAGSNPTMGASTSTPVDTTVSVRISGLPASVKHGANATLVASTTPGATCDASVTYASGTVSTAAGLKPELTAPASGTVSWTWKVGTSTKPGTSTATVTCSLGNGFDVASKAFRVT